ncbi:hypothetical protein ACJZ2D_000092 [Fusarium nematophilum]
MSPIAGQTMNTTVTSQPIPSPSGPSPSGRITTSSILPQSTNTTTLNFGFASGNGDDSATQNIVFGTLTVVLSSVALVVAWVECRRRYRRRCTTEQRHENASNAV